MKESFDFPKNANKWKYQKFSRRINNVNDEEEGLTIDIYH